MLLLQAVEATLYCQPKRGRPLVHSHAAMLLFFITMAFKRIHAFKAMAAYASTHYQRFGFSSPPSRKTLRRRFMALSQLLRHLMPALTLEAGQLDARFHFRIAFVDQSLFYALGGLWHKRHMKAGVVPHSSIDTEATWVCSAYHGWRFGYGLRLVCTAACFPVAALVTTASTKEYHALTGLLERLRLRCLIVATDAGYCSIRVLVQVWKRLNLFVLLRGHSRALAKGWYNQMQARHETRWLYAHRRSSVEPVFALIKTLFELSGESQVPCIVGWRRCRSTCSWSQ